jgi:formylglycine-generating enzyme required for sulfatase activity
MKKFALGFLLFAAACGKPEPPPVNLDGMVLLPAGEFLMGDAAGRPDETPHRVSVSAFYIDRCPVTQELFKKVRKVMSVKQLNELGTMMMAAKKLAPKRPHPRAPDSPPANLVAGIGAGMMDRARAAVRNLAKAGARRAASAKKSSVRRGSTGRKTTRARASQ